MRRCCRTYGTSQSTATLAAPSASTVVLAVHTGQGPALKVEVSTPCGQYRPGDHRVHPRLVRVVVVW